MVDQFIFDVSGLIGNIGADIEIQVAFLELVRVDEGRQLCCTR